MAIGTPTSIGQLNSSGVGTAQTFNTTATVTAGNKIIVAAQWMSQAASARTGTMSGGGLSWTQDELHDAPTYSGVLVSAALFSAEAPSGLASGTTLTLTFSGSVWGTQVGAMQVSGLLDTSYEDVAAMASDITSPSVNWNSGAATTTNADDLIVGFGWKDGGGAGSTSTATGGATELHDMSSTNDWTFTTTYRIVSAAGSYSATGTFTGTGGVASLAGFVAYKAEGGAPPWDPEVDSTATIRTVASGLRQR